MSQPIVVTLPHQLGKAEALRRLQASLSDAHSSGPGLLGVQEPMVRRPPGFSREPSSGRTRPALLMSAKIT
jgi:hypothetical protein